MPHDPTSITQDLLPLSTVRSRVDGVLKEFYRQKIADAESVDESYHALWESMRHLTLAGGKRIRPYLCLLGYQSFGGESIDDVLPVAVAQELLHSSLLIHDDIIDKDYVRYGVPNVAGQFRLRYKELTNSSAQGDHYANSAAILAGDLLLSGAHELIAGAVLSPANILVAQHYLNRAVLQTVAGELLDSEAGLVPPTTQNALKIAKLKTASYSFVAPLAVGAELAGATKNELTILTELATQLGIAYQLIDDVLGVFGEPSQTGKSNSSDITEAKCTYLVAKTLEYSSAREKKFITARLGNAHIADHELEQIRSIMKNCGALDRTKVRARDHVDKALLALESLNLASAPRQAFSRFAASVIDRVA